MCNIKHSVLVPAYNKKAHIAAALDSIIYQSEIPFEVIVQDDYSTDGTWEIILEYTEKYPSLITAVRNRQNLGLFQSLHNIRSLPNGNVVSFCSCDDMLHKNAIKSVNNKIKSENLDPDIESFLIITNSLNLHRDGSLIKWDNFRERHIPPLKTRLRYGLSYRDVGFSMPLLKRVKSDLEFDQVYPGLGVANDLLRCFEEIIQADKIFYINEYGGVYRKNVGVASAHDDNKWKKHLETYRIIKLRYSHLFDDSDLRYLDFIEAADGLMIERTLSNYLKFMVAFIKNIENFSVNNPSWKNLHFLLSRKLANLAREKLYILLLRRRSVSMS